MTNLVNTLYVTTPGAYLRKDHESVLVRVERKTALAVPLHHLAGIVCFGQVGVSHGLLQACGKAGIAVTFLSRSGRFLARVEGPRSASIAVRRAQFRAADDPAAAVRIAKGIVVGKIANSRTLLLRGARAGAVGRARRRLVACIAPAFDSLRLYFLGEDATSRVEHHGAKEPKDLDGPLIV